MTENLADRLQAADRETLDEIIREAESNLQAQLTAALAADQRAVGFAGLAAAAAVVAASGGGALLLGDDPQPWMATLCIVLVVSLTLSMLLALLSARPSPFEFTGNDPANWAGSLDKSLHANLAEMAAHYSDMIRGNQRRMRRNGRLMNAALWLAWSGLAVVTAGAGAAFFWQPAGGWAVGGPS